MTIMRTLPALRDEIIADLDKEYDLVYVEYGDKLRPEQVELIIRGDDKSWEAFWDSTAEFEFESRHQGVEYALEGKAKAVVQRWEREDEAAGWSSVDYSHLLAEFDGSEEEQEVREAIMDRDSGGWVRDLVSQTGSVLLRMTVRHEDFPIELEFGEDGSGPSFEEFLEEVGLPVTPHNLEMAGELLPNVPSSVGMVYAMAGVDLEAIYDLPQDCRVAIVNPYLYVGNPFTGATWVDGPFEGSLEFDRSDLRTDRDAFGYSWEETVGGTHASYYAGTRDLPTRLIEVGAPEVAPEVAA